MNNVNEEQIDSKNVNQPLIQADDMIGRQIGNMDAFTQGSGQLRAQFNQKSESQAVLEKFMMDFKEVPGSKKNEREAMAADNLHKFRALPDDSEATKWDYVAPSDAYGCPKVQSLEDYIGEFKDNNQNPKESFFQKQAEFFTKKYAQSDKTKIEVRSYIQTEDNSNLIRDLAVEIVSTSQGCMPMVKTFERNANASHKYVKTLSFFDTKNDNKLVQKFVVDEGILSENYRNYETSVLQYKNNIIFFRRDQNIHKLCTYDIVSREAKEISGYQIEEPDHGNHRYHLMFSRDFTKQNHSDKELKEFLSRHFLFVQAYQINEDSMAVQHRPLVGYSFKKKFNQRNLVQLIPPNQQLQTLDHPIQHVMHLPSKNDGQITFIAFDSFNSHHFDMNTQTFNYTQYVSYAGNNEVQMVEANREAIRSGRLDDQSLHNQKFSPFLRHQNTHFMVKKEKVEYTINERKKSVEQTFFLTHDNQSMLIYPNYKNTEEKIAVYAALAQQNCYIGDDDDEFNYKHDLEDRLKDYQKVDYKRIVHVSQNGYLSMNAMKKSAHVREILKYPTQFESNDQIILSTDNNNNYIYIFKNQTHQGDNKIEVYKFKNTVTTPDSAELLPTQINQVNKSMIAQYGEQKNEKKKQGHNQSYYLNQKYANVISTPQFIQTNSAKQKLSNDKLTHHMLEKLKDEFVLIEHKNGSYVTIRFQSIFSHEDMEDIVTLETYYKNKTHYVFFMSLINESEKLDRKHSYFMIKKTHKEVENMGSNNNISLVTNDTPITIICNNKFKGESEDVMMNAYTQNMTYGDLIQMQKGPQQWLINLIFEKCVDMRPNVDFVPFVYQEKSGAKTHKLCVFDIHKMKVIKHVSIISNIGLRNHLRKSPAGFGTYTLTRTSEVYNQKEGMFTMHSCGSENTSTQIIKYQVSAQYYLSNVVLPEEYNEHDEKHKYYVNPAQCTLELTEWGINYNCCNNTKIKLIGKKQMYLSKEAQETRKDSFVNCLFIPWLNHEGKVKGSQFIMNDGDSKMQSIRLIDQNFNTMFQRSTDTIQFGSNKFVTSPTSQGEFVVVVASQLRQKIWMDDYFDVSEAYWILQKTNKKVISMMRATFDKYMMNDDFDQMQKGGFYNAREMLDGKSMNDVCVNYPSEIAQGLEQDESLYKHMAGSLMEEICDGSEELEQTYLDMDLCELTLLVNLDFNFSSIIRVAAEMGQQQTVKYILEKINDLNSIDYQDIFMIELSRQLQLPRLDRYYDFLHRDYEEAKEIEAENQKSFAGEKQMKAQFLNFEDFLNHPFLPPFLSSKVNYHAKENFDDFHNTEQEIITEIVNQNPYMTWSVQTFEDDDNSDKKKSTLANLRGPVVKEKNIEVEHSCIDFQKVIIGDKLRAIQEDNYEKVNFNDNHLADIFMINDEDYIEFYNCEAVRKVVDFQFTKTKKFIIATMLIYIFGFLIPYTMSLSITDKVWLNLCYVLCLITQIFFISFEFAQLKEQRLAYFKDPWNLLDSSQFAFFILLFAIKIPSQFSENSLPEIVLQALLLFQSFNKLFYFIRVFETFSFITTMTSLIIYELYPFIFLVCILMTAFCKLYIVQHMGVYGAEYDKIDSPFLKLLIQSYKANKGSVNVPVLDASMSARVSQDEVMSFWMNGLNISVWGVQQCMFLLLGTTFIIQVMQSYERYYVSMPMRLYKVKAQFNDETFDIIDIFFKNSNFKVICFAMAKELRLKQEFEWNGISNAINKGIMEQDYTLKLEGEIDQEILDSRHEKLEETKDLINDVKSKLLAINKQLGQTRNCCCQQNQYGQNERQH